MAVIEFVDAKRGSSHSKFQAWRTKNQNGVFLTMETRTRANLHGARCFHLGSGPPYYRLEDHDHSLTAKRKLCGPESELLAWAASENVKVKRCQTCIRDKLIGGEAAQLDLLDHVFPDEVTAEKTYSEGGVLQVLVNRYERDPLARKACIEHHGTKCSVCNFDFAATYGPMMNGFIHVHHLHPLSECGEDYEVDPIKDMRPICPNCHAVAHRRNPPYSISEIRRLLRK